MNKMDLIQRLKMEKHIEGGYFAETYGTHETIETQRVGSQRRLMSTIYYLLTDDRPLGHFHMNHSNIMHFFHGGSPLTYWIIHPDGRLQKEILGPDITKGHHFQLMVKGGCWKATVLEEGEYGLLSEAVSPGFDYKDMTIANDETLKRDFPKLWPQIKGFVKPNTME